MKRFINISLATVLAVVMTLSLTGSVKAATTTVDLKTAASFAILAGTPNITNVPTSVITGDVGLSPATGFGIKLTQAQVTGTMYAVDAAGPAGTVEDPALVNQAKIDLTAAYDDAAGRTSVATLLDSPELGGRTLNAGVYTTGSTALGITAGAGPLILDGQDDPNAVFIFEGSDAEAGALTVGPGSEVQLINSASACNVFWRVYGAAIDTTAIFKGTILAYTSITAATGANIEGRLLARTGNVTLDHTTVTVPTCLAATTTTPTTTTPTTTTPTTTTTITELPDTGSDTTGNNIVWYILIPATVIAVSTFVIVMRRKKNISQV